MPASPVANHGHAPHTYHREVPPSAAHGRPLCCCRETQRRIPLLPIPYLLVCSDEKTVVSDNPDPDPSRPQWKRKCQTPLLQSRLSFARLNAQSSGRIRSGHLFASALKASAVFLSQKGTKPSRSHCLGDILFTIRYQRKRSSGSAGRGKFPTRLNHFGPLQTPSGLGINGMLNVPISSGTRLAWAARYLRAVIHWTLCMCTCNLNVRDHAEPW
ncbi:hypothetical protein LY78DRAFT_422032 [Colletotrichum sublineola]|nr:hypothetical protein LY78DRAFT_422032 [Colletotrichum sublineola]